MRNRPTPLVWVSIGLVALHGVLWVITGVVLVLRPQPEMDDPPPNALVPILDPFSAGIVNFVLAASVGWLTYRAVVSGSCVRCFAVAGVFFLLAVLGSAGPWETPWDAARYAVVGTYLFIGIGFIRWGRRLVGRRGS